MKFRIGKIFYGLRGNILKYVSAASIIPLILSLLLLYFVTRNSITEKGNQDLTTTIENIKSICQIESEVIDESLQKSINDAYEIAGKELSTYPVPELTTEKKQLKIKHQDTQAENEIQLPVMRIGNKEVAGSTEIVDRIIERIAIPGATSTIFQFHDEKLIRVSTTVKNSEGKRAHFTYLPKESPVFRTINEGYAYEGRAVVVGKWCITRYEPLRDNNGSIIGALYVGIPAPDLGIFKIIHSTKVGKSGYIMVINSSGQIVDHPFLPRGTSTLTFSDAKTGSPFGQEIIKQKHGNITFNFKNKNGVIVKQLAHFTYFPKWDWIIMSVISYDDMFETLNMIFRVIVIMLILLPVILMLASNLLALRITRPFQRIIGVAVRVSKGDLTNFIRQEHYRKCVQMKGCTNTECPAYNSHNLACWNIECTHRDKDGSPLSADRKLKEYCSKCRVYKNAIRDENDLLIEAINAMIVTTKNFVHEIKNTTLELTRKSEELANISTKMEKESQLQASSIEETTSANEQLLAAIENVAHSADTQAERVSQTSAAMEELTSSTRIVSENSVNASKATKNTVIEARNTGDMLRDTTARINQVAESSKKIVDIVAMINDISDQINLLSLNAAIEAARAGEHGKGFAVVSEEISKLADATAQSTREIENVIKGIRLDIDKGADLVNKTNDAITRMIEKIDQASGMIEEIAVSSEEQIRGSEQVMKDVEEINTMSGQIATSTGEQKVTSSEILKALTRINDSIQEIAGSTITIAESANSLKEKSAILTGITDHFKV